MYPKNNVRLSIYRHPKEIFGSNLKMQWNKLKDYFIEYSIPTIITAALFGIIIYFFTINIFPKTKIIPPPAPSPYENKMLIPKSQTHIVNRVEKKEDITIPSPKIKVKIRIAGKYISENKNYVMYERIDTRKQRNVTVEDFLNMCECSPTELYTDRLMEIFEYP